MPEFREFSFTGEYCQPRPMTKCFNYMKKVCVPQSKTEYKVVAWQNEKLKVISDTLALSMRKKAIWNPILR